MNKTIATFLMAFFVLLGLSGCADYASGTANDPRKDELVVYQQALPDGRIVTCVSWHTTNGGAPLSCDWTGAK